MEKVQEDLENLETEDLKESDPSHERITSMQKLLFTALHSSISVGTLLPFLPRASVLPSLLLRP